MLRAEARHPHSGILGAMVLAHSLRDNGTKKKLAALVTLDTLQASTIDELKVYIHLVVEPEEEELIRHEDAIRPHNTSRSNRQ